MERSNDERTLRRQDAFLDAYEVSASVSRAAEVSRVPHKWHARWMKEDTSYAERFAALQERMRAAGRRFGTGKGRPRLDWEGRQQALLDAFGRIGLLGAAAKEVGVTLNTHLAWMRQDPAYAERFAAARAEVDRLGLAKANRKKRASTPVAKGQRFEQTTQRKAAFLKMLTEVGIVTDVAEALGFDVSLVYAWAKKDVQFAAAFRVALDAGAEAAAETKRARQSAASKAMWQDPEFRELHRESVTHAWTPERRAEVGERLRGLWEDPEFVAKRNEGLRRAWEDPELRSKRSELSKAMWEDPATRERLLAGQRTPEIRAKRAAVASRRWANMTPDECDAMIRRMRAGIPGEGSRLELAVRVILNGTDIGYQVQRPFGLFTADIYFPHLKLDLEADGEYAHAGRKASDAERDAALAEQGVTTLRLTEAEIDAGDFSRLLEALGLGD